MADELRVRVLGPLEVEGIAPHEVGSRKARSLVKLLAVHRGVPVAVDTIVDALWGDEAPARASEQVGVLVSRLRRSLGADRLVRTDAGYALQADWVDVAELDARADEAAQRLETGTPGAARAAAAAALELARGPLVADEDAGWADDARAAVERTLARVRLLAAEAALRSGDAVGAAAAAEGALDHDPYDERALRLLMRAHAAAGRPASALAAYARVRVRLAEDLGVDPTSETETLHTEILLGGAASDDDVAAEAPPELAGRAAELAALDDAFAQVLAGRAVGVVIEGEAGIGKSTLVDAWTSAHAVPRGAIVLAGRCDELGRELPLQPVIDALDLHLRSVGEEQATQLLGVDAGVVAPLLGSHRAAVTATMAVADPDAARGVLYAALLAVVERLSAVAPVVLSVDDIHLAAPATIEWLQLAVRRGSRLLVLATRRPEGSTLTGAVQLVLGPLALEAVAEIVGPERAGRLHERSGGHPLFLAALAAADDEHLPTSVREAVTSRADALGAAAATTLRTAAVLGLDVDLDLLAAVLRLPAGEVLEHLEAGAAARLLTDRGAALGFAHDLVREALDVSTSAARRAFVHREGARALAARPQHEPLDVAWHARHGGDVELAADALVRAAEVAASRYDLAEAQRLLGDAIELADSAPARLARARARVAVWQLDDARRDTERALQLGAGAEGFELAGWVEYYARDYDAARRFAEEGVRRATDETLRGSCLTLVGRVFHSRGDVIEAERLLRDAEAAAGRSPQVRGLANVWLGGLLNHRGAPAAALDAIDPVVLGGDRLNHPFAYLHGLFARIAAFGHLGRVDEALAAVDELARVVVAEKRQGERFAAVARNMRGWVFRNLGLLDAADEQNAHAVALSDGRGAAYAEMRYAGLLDLVDGRFAAGDVDGAGEALERASGVEDWHGTMAWHQRDRYRLLHARLALVQGDPVAALEIADEVASDNEARGTRRYELLARLVGVRAAAEAGRDLDAATVDDLLRAVPAVAGLEAWWLTAEVAAAAGSNAWWSLAEQRADVLANAAAGRRDEVRAAVRTRLDALRR